MDLLTCGVKWAECLYCMYKYENFSKLIYILTDCLAGLHIRNLNFDLYGVIKTQLPQSLYCKLTCELVTAPETKTSADQ